MKITVNNKPREFQRDSIPLEELLRECDMPKTGIAVAVNNKVVRSKDRENTEIMDGDNVMVIQAVCGG